VDRDHWPCCLRRPIAGLAVRRRWSSAWPMSRPSTWERSPPGTLIRIAADGPPHDPSGTARAECRDDLPLAEHERQRRTQARACHSGAGGVGRGAELEWIESRGECRQQWMWFGTLCGAAAQRTATVLQRGSGNPVRCAACRTQKCAGAEHRALCRRTVFCRPGGNT